MSALFERDATLLGELIDEEMDAITKYGDAIEHCESGYLDTTLRRLRESHTGRVRLLTDCVERLGHRHRPATGPDAHLEGHAATRTGSEEIRRDRAILQGLLETEDRLEARYRAVRSRLATEIQRFLDARIMTEERWVHYEVRELAHQVHPEIVTPPWGPAPRG